jgi:hypothetical protein
LAFGRRFDPNRGARRVLVEHDGPSYSLTEKEIEVFCKLDGMAKSAFPRDLRCSLPDDWLLRRRGEGVGTPDFAVETASDETTDRFQELLAGHSRTPTRRSQRKSESREGQEVNTSNLLVRLAIRKVQ